MAPCAAALVVSSGNLFPNGLHLSPTAALTSPESLDAVTHLLLDTAVEYGWTLRAWAVLANHYHFLAESPAATGESLRDWLKDFHRRSAMRVNELASAPGRRVWMYFRETRITHQTS